MARTKRKATKAKPARGKVVKRIQAKAKGKPVAAKRKPVVKKTASAAPARDANAATRALAKRIIDVTLRDRDEEILALYADDIESSEAGQPPQVGLAALRAKYAGWRGMTSATAFEPRRVAVDGKVIVIEWIGRVTLAASGRQVEMQEVAVHEIRNGKIAREAFYYNPAVLA
jgi:ketosteroid isomerase-like protein